MLQAAKCKLQAHWKAHGLGFDVSVKASFAAEDQGITGFVVGPQKLSLPVNFESIASLANLP